jgi:hypothetical protein
LWAEMNVFDWESASEQDRKDLIVRFLEDQSDAVRTHDGRLLNAYGRDISYDVDQTARLELPGAFIGWFSSHVCLDEQAYEPTYLAKMVDAFNAIYTQLSPKAEEERASGSFDIKKWQDELTLLFSEMMNSKSQTLN